MRPRTQDPEEKGAQISISWPLQEGDKKVDFNDL